MNEPPRDEQDKRDTADYDFLRTDTDAPLASEHRRTIPVFAILVVVLGIVIGAAWFYISRQPGQTTTPSQAESTSGQPSADVPLPAPGTSPELIDVPPLDESDAVVRELVNRLTSHPTVAAWLATDGLIRNFTVVVTNIADGVSPARHLRVLRPTGPFAVMQEENRQVIDPRSFRRFDRIAAAVASADPAGAARLYATLRPRIEEAYRDLGHPDTPVDRTVERAIVRLLETPVVDRPTRVEPGTKGIGYVYADPMLESLSAAQKQLLRMGPENVRVIQGWLRAVALAMGIPEERLPSRD